MYKQETPILRVIGSDYCKKYCKKMLLFLLLLYIITIIFLIKRNCLISITKTNFYGK